MDNPSNLKENPVVGTAGLDEENSGKQFSNWIVLPRPEGVNNEKRRGCEPIGVVLQRVYAYILSDAWGKP
jgi:hypothetical protein